MNYIFESCRECGERHNFCPPHKEELFKALLTVHDDCFSYLLNMNDTFAYACGDSETMEAEYDFCLMIPIIAEHGNSALIAYTAVKRGEEPITCKCHYKDDDYYKAKEKVEKLKQEDKYFMDLD